MGALSSLPKCSQCSDSWGKSSQDTGKGTQESSMRSSLCPAATQPHTPAWSRQHSGIVLSYRSTVPEPVLSGCHPLHPSFHREAVKQLQFIMSCAVSGQTRHKKAWFAGTKQLSKLEAFPEKFTVQDEDPHNLVTVTGTNSAKRVHISDIQSTATTHITVRSSLQHPELHPCTEPLHMELRGGDTPGPHSALHSPLSLSRDRFFVFITPRAGQMQRSNYRDFAQKQTDQSEREKFTRLSKSKPNSLRTRLPGEP